MEAPFESVETELYRHSRRPYNGGSKMQSQRATTADLSGLYDEDFFEWTRRNAELLRTGQVRASDIEHIAEEIEDLGKQDLKELHRRSRALLAHLLLWQLHPGKRSSLLSITKIGRAHV